MTSGIVLISGASSGIGEATARRYAKEGARVLLLARNEGRLAEVAKSIEGDGGSATAYAIDLSDPAAIEELAARIVREIGIPDTIVNNAGAGRWLSFLDTTPAEALSMIEVPYLAAFTLTRAFLPHMLLRGRGRVGFISSPASYIAWPNAAAYIAARRAVAGLADTLRTEIKGSGVSVTLVVLGTVDSPYWQHNPGSRAHLPESSIIPTLSCEQAAEAIYAGVEGGKRLVVRPAIFRLLFILNAFFPSLVARQLRRAAKRSLSNRA